MDAERAGESDAPSSVSFSATFLPATVDASRSVAMIEETPIAGVGAGRFRISPPIRPAAGIAEFGLAAEAPLDRT
jgi:hypothetical protein